MKGVVLYTMAENITMEEILAVYPRHKAIVDQLVTEGKVIGIGPFSNPHEGALSIFINKAAAEEFVAIDPFVLEGVVGSYVIREWRDM